MRKNILFMMIALLCMVGVSEATAQAEVERYYPEGTVWTECWYTEDSDDTGNFAFMKYTVTQDTVIDGRTYQRVVMERKYSRTEEAENTEWKYDHTFHIRQDGKQVYYHREEINGKPAKDILRYDFGCSVGEQAPVHYNVSSDSCELQTVSSIKPVTMKDGSILDGIYFDSRPNMLRQVSTIGSVNYWDGLMEVNGLYTWNPFHQYYIVTSFTRNGVVLLERSHEEILAAMAVKKTVVSENDDAATYTIDGLRIPTGQPQKPGIYIRNHKKLVVK